MFFTGTGCSGVCPLTPELCRTEMFCLRTKPVWRKAVTSSPAGGQLSPLDLMVYNQGAAGVSGSDLELTLPTSRWNTIKILLNHSSSFSLLGTLVGG